MAATARNVDRPVDNNGQVYNAIRVAWLWNLAVPDTLTHSAGPFLASTKVIRITPSYQVFMSVTIVRTSGNLGPMIIGNGVYQDFEVQPGDTINVVGVTGYAAGKYASIVEMV